MTRSPHNSNIYKIEIEEVLENRRVFYNLRRNSDDLMTTWLKRIEHCIHRCDFPTIFTEFLLIDRFVCGLNSVELKTIQNSDNWTLNQVLEQFADGSFNTAHIEAGSVDNRSCNQNAHITLGAVKSELVCTTIDYIFVFHRDK